MSFIEFSGSRRILILLFGFSFLVCSSWHCSEKRASQTITILQRILEILEAYYTTTYFSRIT